ncbi:MAG: hypothetical protein LUE96_06805 [Lachnospiraceae bacterium]|nr:hypothetical protein [Lachnospiraceae bacterium]
MDRFTQNADNTAGFVRSDYGKYRKIYYKNAVPDSRVLVFLAGFCLGMVFFYVSGIELIGEGRLPAAFSADNISKLRDFEVNEAGLLEYAAGERLGQRVFMAICATSFMGALISYAIIGCAGFEMSIMMFAFIYQYGLKGLFFSVMLLVPHGIFYFAAFWLIFGKYWTSGSDKYCCSDCGTLGRFTKLKRIAAILLIWFMGILSEVYINPGIIKKITIFFK